MGNFWVTIGSITALQDPLHFVHASSRLILQALQVGALPWRPLQQQHKCHRPSCTAEPAASSCRWARWRGGPTAVNSWRWAPWVECACGPGLGPCRGEPQQASRHPRLSALCCATCQAQHMNELGSCLALRAHHVRSCPRSASWSPVLLTPLSLALLQARRTAAQPDIPEGPGVGRHHVAQLVAQWAAAGWRLRGVCGLSCLGCSLGQGHTHRSRWVGRLLGADAVRVWCQGWGSCWLVPHRGGQAFQSGPQPLAGRQALQQVGTISEPAAASPSPESSAQATCTVCACLLTCAACAACQPAALALLPLFRLDQVRELLLVSFIFHRLQV